MPIDLNMTDDRFRVERLYTSLNTYWKVAKNARTSGVTEAYANFFSQATKNKNGLTKNLTGNSFASEKEAFQRVYGWDDATWNTFLSEADSVHQTLVPNALTRIINNEAEFSKAGFNELTGDRTWGSPSAPVKALVDADLLAIENEFTV